VKGIIFVLIVIVLTNLTSGWLLLFRNERTSTFSVCQLAFHILCGYSKNAKKSTTMLLLIYNLCAVAILYYNITGVCILRTECRLPHSQTERTIVPERVSQSTSCSATFILMSWHGTMYAYRFLSTARRFIMHPGSIICHILVRQSSTIAKYSVFPKTQRLTLSNTSSNKSGPDYTSSASGQCVGMVKRVTKYNT